MKKFLWLSLPLSEILLVPALAPTPLFSGVTARTLGTSLFLLVFAVVASWIYLTEDPDSPPRSFRPWGLVPHCLCTGAFVASALFQSGLRQSLGAPLTLCVTLLLGFVTVVSAVPLFLSPRELRSRFERSRARGFIVVVALVTILVGGCLDEKFWTIVGWPTGRLILLALDLTRVPFESHWGAGGSLHITHPSFKVVVYAPCSGLEGITFFWFVWSMLLLFEERPPTFGAAFALWCGGTVYMFFLNVARIIAYLLVGIWASAHLMQEANVVVSLFHANVGWVIYLVGITAFFALTMSRNDARIKV